MPKLTYTPNTDIMSVLKAKQRKSFSVVDIRDGLLKISTKTDCPSSLRRWVNGQFQTLMKHKYIEASPSPDKKNYYKNTDKTLSFDISVNEKENTNEFKTNISSTVNSIEERLKECKIEMLAFVGETKEYVELSKLYPEIREQLQSKFNIAQTKNMEYRGRVKALESVLAENTL
jgi:hypothetical protein